MPILSGTRLYWLSTLVTLAACQSQERQKHLLREFVDVGTIEAVEAHNYSGHHWLTAAELRDFKNQFGAMTYQPGGGGQLKSVDMGATMFVLHLRGRSFHLIGRPSSQALGVPDELLTRNRSGLAGQDQQSGNLRLFTFSQLTNINNYRKGPKIRSRPN